MKDLIARIIFHCLECQKFIDKILILQKIDFTPESHFFLIFQLWNSWSKQKIFDEI